VTLTVILIAATVRVAPADPPEGPRIGAPPPALRLDSFYAKHLSVNGLPVVSSDRVSDEALREAARLVGRMLHHRRDIGVALVEAHVRVVVMAPTEQTTDVPEHRDLTPKEYWDARARGLGATRSRPAVSCGEENLLGLEDDRYRGECILIHEFAHTIHEMGLVSVEPGFDEHLEGLFDRAMEKGLWKDTYAATNSKEYWAEGVQSFFDSNRQADPPDGIHNSVDTREELAEYDPELAKLISRIFRDDPWRWERPGAHGRKVTGG